MKHVVDVLMLLKFDHFQIEHSLVLVVLEWQQDNHNLPHHHREYHLEESSLLPLVISFDRTNSPSSESRLSICASC